MKNLLIVLVLFLSVYKTHSQNNYRLKYESHDDDYSTPETFTKIDISSDFGVRRLTAYDWHPGVDYGNPNDNTEIEDHILSVVNEGLVRQVNGKGFKKVIIEGVNQEPHFGYGHLFEHGVVPYGGNHCGDMVLKKMNSPYKNHYAIINLNSGIAIGELSSATVTYDGITYDVTRNVNYEDPVGIIGNSGLTNPFPIHLHLYLFEDIEIAICDHGNENNDFDPLSVINYKNNPSSPDENYTEYTIRILETDDNSGNQALTQIISDGGDNSSIVVRTIMNNETYEETNTHYENDVMDIYNVKVFIRPNFCNNESNSNWGNEASNYKMIIGPDYRSEIDLGARIGDNKYPPNIIFRYGDHENTGVYPWAYDDNQGYPYDDYYFSDFYTRIHKNNSGNGDKLMAQNNFQARYPDGEYNLYAKATTVRNDPETNDYVFTNEDEPFPMAIDNFAPFIQKLMIYTSQDKEPESLAYAKEWIWSDNGYTEGTAIRGEINTEELLLIEIYASEAMNELSLKINGELISDPVISDDRMVWEFNYSNSLPGTYHLLIDGFDMNSNHLQPDALQLPLRNGPEQYDFNPPLNSGPDENHYFIITEPSPLDFTYWQDPFAFGMFNLTFTSVSNLLNISTYLWNFGDGSILSANKPQTEYSYGTDGQYSVNHTVESMAGTYSVDKIVKVDKIEKPTSDFYMKLIKLTGNQENDMYEISFADASSGIVGEWKWNINGTIYTSANYENRNPQPVHYDFSNGNFNVKLTVSNATGSDQKEKSVDPFYLPMLDLWTWINSYCSRKFELITHNLDPPYNYAIDYGDGSKEELTNQIFSMIDFDHQYYKPGKYKVVAEVSGINPESSERFKTGTFTEINIEYYHLEIDVTAEADNIPAYPLKNVSFTPSVTPEAGTHYWAYWIIKKEGTSNDFYFLQTDGTSIADLKLNYQFQQAGIYHIQLNVVDDHGRQGVYEYDFTVENAPDYIHASICCGDDPVQVCINSQYAFYATAGSGPKGSPGVHDSLWFPTNQRWTLLKLHPVSGEEEILEVYQPDAFQYTDHIYTLNRSAAFDFEGRDEGNYIIRFEFWNKNHNYEENSVLSPVYENSICFYDYDEIPIELRADLATLELAPPLNTYNSIYLDASGQDFIIDFINPGQESVSWYTDVHYYESSQGFINIQNPNGNGLCNSETETLHCSISEWNETYDRKVLIIIKSDDIPDQSGLNNTLLVYVNQWGINGPEVQEIFADNSFTGQNFGLAASVYKDILVIGAPGNPDQNNGKAYVYGKNNFGVWQKEAELVPSNPQDRRLFANDLEVYEDFIIIGNKSKEKAFVFKKPVNGWSGIMNEIVELDNNGSGGDKYGTSVTIWGDYAAVGAPYNDHNGNNAGKVQVYYRNQGGIDNWGRVKTLHDCTQTDFFGYDVDLFNDILIIGAPQHDDYWGFVNVYKRNFHSSNDWGLYQHLKTTDMGVVSNHDNAKLGKTVSIFDHYMCSHLFQPLDGGETHKLKSVLYDVHESDWENLSYPVEIDYKMINYPPWSDDNHADESAVYINEYSELQTIHGYSTYNDNTGAYLSGNHRIPYQSVPVFNILNQFGNHVFGCKSVFGGINYYGYGLPATDNYFNNVEKCGSVFINNNITGFHSYCEASLDLSLINFSKPPGNYPCIEARDLILGGMNYPAEICSGAAIEFKGKDITLFPGFIAQEGSVVEINAVFCGNQNTASGPLKAGPILTGKYNNGSGSVSNDGNILKIELFSLIEKLKRSYSGFSLNSMNIYKDIQNIIVMDHNNSPLYKIDNPHPYLCYVDFDRVSLSPVFLLINLHNRCYKIEI